MWSRNCGYTVPMFTCVSIMYVNISILWSMALLHSVWAMSCWIGNCGEFIREVPLLCHCACMYVACKMIVDELQYAIKKEDPKKMIEVCMYIHAYVCMYECTYVYMYARMYVYMHVCYNLNITIIDTHVISCDPLHRWVATDWIHRERCPVPKR